MEETQYCHSSKNAIDALEACNASLFPNVWKLLTILATLPVTTATSERSFGIMRPVKTYLRLTIGEQRLTGLALLLIHLERLIDNDSVLNENATCSKTSDFILKFNDTLCWNQKAWEKLETHKTMPTFKTSTSI